MNTDLITGNLLLNNKKSRVPLVITYILIISFFLVGSIYLFFAMTDISGTSMENTIMDGEQALTLRYGYNIERGDIVTFNVGTRSEPHELIKRVIGISGDKLVFVSDRSRTYVDLYLCKRGETNFRLVDEPYIKERMLYNKFAYNPALKLVQYFDRQTIENIDISKTLSGENETVRQALIAATIDVPQKQFYFLGDNRNVSRDSRYYGTLKTSCINGKVLLIVKNGTTAYKFLNFFFGHGLNDRRTS